MAQVTRVELIDDLTGEALPDGEGVTVEFGLDGDEYEIDLSSHNAGLLRDFMGDYITRGRKVAPRTTAATSRRKTTGPRGTARPTVDREQTRAIRDWARSAGHEVSDRGRVSSKLVAAYEQAHARHAGHAGHEQAAHEHVTHEHAGQEDYAHAMAG